MDNGTITAANLLRMVGMMGIAVGIAWAMQTIGFGEPSVASKLMWVMAAASMAGAGAGLLFAASRIQDDEVAPARA